MTIVQELLAGTFGGGLQAIVGHPLDLLKTRMQNTPHEYSSFLQSTKLIFHKEGIAGFFRGLSVPLLNCGVTNAALFCFYSSSKRIVASISGTATVEELTLPHICVSSWLASPFYCFILCPIEVLKVNVQTRTYASPWQAIQALGPKGLYRGYLPTLGTRITGSPAYFCTYETLKSFLLQHDLVEEQNPSAIGLICGFFAGIAFWSINYPLDTIKTKCQIDKHHTGPFHTGVGLLRHEGMAGLYRGFIPCILRAGPANAVAFAGFEFGMRQLTY
jgi:solute carrier family 25 carnitine/acylcarnitine transporter 20/29|tara:strand:- start:2815 stop:3636 length:822 start_codon:yes stop_codon:yes gene_type:complete